MGRRSHGYTIIETLIFIAVSGMMFMSAVILVGGRQQEVEFSQGVRDLENKLKDTLNDVSTGYFPANNSLNCTIATGAGAGVFRQSLLLEGVAKDQATAVSLLERCSSLPRWLVVILLTLRFISTH